MYGDLETRRKDYAASRSGAGALVTDAFRGSDPGNGFFTKMVKNHTGIERTMSPLTRNMARDLQCIGWLFASLPVQSLTTGEPIGRVKDVRLDRDALVRWVKVGGKSFEWSLSIVSTYEGVERNRYAVDKLSQG